MNVHSTETLDQTSEMRVLTDAEIDEVNGGFWIAIYLWSVALGVGAGLATGGVEIGDQVAF
jgi:hypothetical protein